MKDREKLVGDLAKEINRLNALVSEKDSQINELELRNMALENFLVSMKFHVDLDGDMVLYNRFILFQDPDFAVFMDAVQRHKIRWGITGPLS